MSEIAHRNLPASARSKRAMLRSKASGTAIAVSEHAQKQKVFDKLEGYRKMFLFSYSTEHLLNKDKVRFYYALKGRDGKSGIVKFTSANYLGRACLLVKEKYGKEVEDFLGYWNCKFNEKGVLVKG